MILEEAVKILKEECTQTNNCAECPLFDKRFPSDACICGLLNEAEHRLENLKKKEVANVSTKS